jgi:23S rRNA (guanosine2251-2'-O)-methyltransferase
LPTDADRSHEHVFGRNAAIEALRGRRPVRRLLIAAGAHGPDVALLRRLAAERRVPLALVDRARLDRLAGPIAHQGVVAEVAPFPYSRVDDLLAVAAARAEPPLLLALDGIQDPHNLGSLLRTALAAGAHGALIPEHRAVAVTPAVARASAGAVEHLRVARVTNLSRALAELKARGVWAYGLAADARQRYWEVDWLAPSVVVVGSEGTGLGRLVRSTCDALVAIPMAPGALGSLNAAVAGALVLYEAFRRRAPLIDRAQDGP